MTSRNKNKKDDHRQYEAEREGSGEEMETQAAISAVRD